MMLTTERLYGLCLAGAALLGLTNDGWCCLAGKVPPNRPVGNKSCTLTYSMTALCLRRGMAGVLYMAGPCFQEAADLLRRQFLQLVTDQPHDWAHTASWQSCRISNLAPFK